MKRYGVAAGLLLALALALALASSGSAAHDAFPGGNGRIAFLRGNQKLFVMNADGSHQNRLLRNAGVAPAWSPDGRRLIAVGGFGTPPAHVDPEFVSSPVGSPSWSPDGRHFVGITGGGDSLNEVDVVDVDSDVQRQIYLDDGMGLPTPFNPAWSPDGRLIAFNDERGNLFFLVGAQHRLRAPAHGIGGMDPAWSPDGRQLAVGTFTGVYLPGPTPKSSSVFTARADGTQFRRIARNASQPAWSPDGRKIVFVRLLARGNSEIFVMNADGTHQRRLTFNPGADSAPDWQPLPR